ncbi:MAG: hypothetical protein K9G58_08495 [Bacteroidales bacterium]|nr:hypothetical protein [Bacteroidales bacterium]MCF8398191.1 hypothetical protein [Bacteroidales bacterium]
MKQLIIKIVLAIVIVVLVYLVVQSVSKPVKFNKEKERRENVVINRLKDIRSAQLLFKNYYDGYAPTWDTMISFLETAEIPIVKIMPDPEDTTFTKTINDTIGYINAADSLFKGNIAVEEIKYIPFSDGEIFEINAGKIEKGSVKVNVFEVSCLYEQFLKGLEEQLIVNLVATRKQLDKFPGLKVGSMEEPSTDGNWEY